MAAAEHRALFIAPTLPSGTGNGLAIRLGLFAEALARVGRIDLLVIPVFSRAAGDGLVSRLGFETMVVDPVGREDTQFQLLSRLTEPVARLDAFRQYGRGSLAARLSRAVLDEARKRLVGRRYDLVHVGRGYMMQAAEIAGGGAVLTADLDEDDAWTWRSLAKIQPAGGAARWAIAEAEAADRELVRLAPRFRDLFISGPVDGRRLARRHAGVRPLVVPNPAPAQAAPMRRAEDGRTLLFIGSFGYAPNLDGLEWFLNGAWPVIRRARPALRLAIVGADLPARLAARDGEEGIAVMGAVPDLGPLYGMAMLALAPLRAGGGTRLKLIEAAAFGVPAVATSLAARGLAFGEGRYMWIADTPADFADAVIAAGDAPEERARRAAYAQRIVRDRHDRAAIVERLACRFAALMAQ
jgi:glycosyltransferase involved in cell wall biosynthesis